MDKTGYRPAQIEQILAEVKTRSLEKKGLLDDGEFLAIVEQVKG